MQVRGIDIGGKGHIGKRVWHLACTADGLPAEVGTILCRDARTCELQCALPGVTFCIGDDCAQAERLGNSETVFNAVPARCGDQNVDLTGRYGRSMRRRECRLRRYAP